MGSASKDWQIAVGLFQAMADGQGSLGKPMDDPMEKMDRLRIFFGYCGIVTLITGDS